MNKIVFALLISMSVLFFAGCDSKNEIDAAAIHKQKISEGFKHYHVNNPEGKEYNLIMMVLVDNSGRIHIGAAAHAREARDTGDFDVYIKELPSGFLFHYLANNEYVKWGGGNLSGVTAYVAAPETIKSGDCLLKTSTREDKTVSPDWSIPAVDEIGVKIVTLLWDKNYSPDDESLIAAVKEELKKR